MNNNIVFSFFQQPLFLRLSFFIVFQAGTFEILEKISYNKVIKVIKQKEL